MKKISLLVLLVAGLSATSIAQTDQAKMVATYTSAWGEPDAAKREALLEASFSESGEYSDPTAMVEGRDALVKHIGGFLSQNPGASFQLLRPAEFHNEKYGRFEWIMQLPDGTVGLIGMDFVVFDDQGMIQQITGFFETSVGQ
ncbi:MAG TPA: nuclear transport factor 2 family protein [Cytophagales bacterium]|nr:nuclear transport factor 2 family protein [Cytophagales bacterium]HAA19523.1 nuclear transport factor 2 family protein [Cytophagales bacterium]HAP59603.1 nuclear transport factor 2 family protein [Cytophagales bacterium]